MKKQLFSVQTEQLLRRAYTAARTLGHSYVGTEHLLLSLLCSPALSVCKTLRSFGWEARTCRVLLCSGGKGSEILPLPQGLTPHAKILLQQAKHEAKQLGASRVEPEHLLLALTREESCTAARMLMESGTDLNCVFSDAYTGINRPRTIQTEGKRTNMRLLELYCENMAEKAAQAERVIGREKEIALLLQVLSRKNKNNPALIGEPGVGKTAIVEALAQRIASGQVPESLRGKKLYSLNMASVLAGTKYRGEFEERIRDILAEIRRQANVILFIDEMHIIVGAGSAEGAIDAANLLKPALGRGEVQMIGATTLEEYRKFIEKDAALERRFRPITVREPSKEETAEILLGLRTGLEQHHGLHITEEAIHASVELSCRYLTDRFLPDKALDLLDESASRAGIGECGSETEQKRRQITKELEQAVADGAYEKAAVLRDELQNLMRKQAAHAKHLRGRVLTAQDIAATVSERTGVPIGKIGGSERQRLCGLHDAISKRIIGQDAAVTAVCRAVLRGRMGVTDGKRPIASMLFTGPSGVGKTELCKTLADEVYGSREALIRIDMTEYMEPNSVARLIGAPPGYIGHDEPGVLTEKVRRRPYSVILFDELEKAHRDVTGLLLQIMDDGILTDSVGRCVDFKNTIVVMTSNLGSGQIGKPGLGFTPDGQEGQMAKILRENFSVEFLGRIDCVAQFCHLGTESLTRIAQKMLQEAAARCERQGLPLTLTDDAARALAEQCVKEDGGARSLRRKIQTLVEEPAAEVLLTQTHPMRCRLCVKDGKIVLEHEK